MLLNSLNRDSLKHFVLIEVSSVDILVACLRNSTGSKGGSFRLEVQRDVSMRALWSDKQNCSHSLSSI